MLSLTSAYRRGLDPFLHLADHISLNVNRKPYDPDQPDWVFERLHASDNSTLVTKYMRALVPETEDKL